MANFSKQNFTTFTVTIADPAVFTSTAHELYTGDTVVLETTGALPTGLAVKTTYYVVYNGITADTFQLARSPVGNMSGNLSGNFAGATPLATTGSQSGTHKFLKTNRARLVPNYESNK